MPVELVDENGQEIDLDKADGGTLRKKLEEALAENKTLAEYKVTTEAEKVIGSDGLSLVKPEDLKGVAPDEVEAKAKALQEERQAERTETVRSVFAERGLEGDELDSAVESFLAGNEVDAGTENPTDDPDFADLVSIGGTRPTNKSKAPGMDDAMGNLTGHFEEK